MTLVGPSFFFDSAELLPRARAAALSYRSATPYPHAVFDDFLGRDLARGLAAGFPGPAHPGWKRRDYVEQAARLGQLARKGFRGVDPAFRHLLGELSSMAFLDFLGALTGHHGLIADPHFRGGGPSLTLPGGHLALHADFDRDRNRHLARKVTVIYYLGTGAALPEGGWDEAWGGALELWNHPPARCEARYAPKLDRLVVMDHGDTFWHGHPAPLACPEGCYRASVSAYFYAAAATADEADAHAAIWAAPLDADDPSVS